jgi:hypothetical protein
VTGAFARALALVWLAFVLPGDRVVGLLAESRAGRTPLRVEGKLTARDSSAPAHLVIELHPDLGARVSDDKGGRWLVANGRASAGTKLPAPEWVLDLAPLVLRHESELRAWLAAEGVDVGKNELARCGDSDCFVLGTRQSASQLWIEKSAFDLRRVVRPHPPRTSYDDWQMFGKIRFPARIELADDSGPIAALAVESVDSIPLAQSDLDPSWVQAAPASKRR